MGSTLDLRAQVLQVALLSHEALLSTPGTTLSYAYPGFPLLNSQLQPPYATMKSDREIHHTFWGGIGGWDECPTQGRSPRAAAKGADSVNGFNLWNQNVKLLA